MLRYLLNLTALWNSYFHDVNIQTHTHTHIPRLRVSLLLSIPRDALKYTPEQQILLLKLRTCL